MILIDFFENDHLLFQKVLSPNWGYTLRASRLSLPKMLTGPNAFEISNIGSQS